MAIIRGPTTRGIPVNWLSYIASDSLTKILSIVRTADIGRCSRSGYRGASARLDTYMRVGRAASVPHAGAPRSSSRDATEVEEAGHGRQGFEGSRIDVAVREVDRRSAERRLAQAPCRRLVVLDNGMRRSGSRIALLVLGSYVLGCDGSDSSGKGPNPATAGPASSICGTFAAAIKRCRATISAEVCNSDEEPLDR